MSDGRTSLKEAATPVSLGEVRAVDLVMVAFGLSLWHVVHATCDGELQMRLCMRIALRLGNMSRIIVLHTAQTGQTGNRHRRARETSAEDSTPEHVWKKDAPHHTTPPTQHSHPWCCQPSGCFPSNTNIRTWSELQRDSSDPRVRRVSAARLVHGSRLITRIDKLDINSTTLPPALFIELHGGTWAGVGQGSLSPDAIARLLQMLAHEQDGGSKSVPSDRRQRFDCAREQRQDAIIRHPDWSTALSQVMSLRNVCEHLPSFVSRAGSILGVTSLNTSGTLRQPLKCRRPSKSVPWHRDGSHGEPACGGAQTRLVIGTLPKS